MSDSERVDKASSTATAQPNLSAEQQQELAEFLASEPPRSVPRFLLRRLSSKGAGCLALFFLVFGALGCFFAVMFVPWGIVRDWRLDSASEVVAGVIVAVEETYFTINHAAVMRMRYEFETLEGVQVAGASYTHDYENLWDVGERVQVEYGHGRPSWNRVVNTRTTVPGGVGLLVLMFPAIGLGGVAVVMGLRRRRVQLLRHGEFARGEIIEVRRTNVEVNGQARYFVFVDYEADPHDQPGATARGRYSAYGTRAEMARKWKSSGRRVGLFFRPHKPQWVVVVDDLIFGDGGTRSQRVRRRTVEDVS